MPCSPNIDLNVPSGPSGPAIPGFGQPFALKLPEIGFPDGFPEDLLDIFDKLQFLMPPGAIKPSLNPNFGKDVFDGIMKMLDQFFPFLMLYKFFLPILQLIICIIEIICSLTNPFKLIRAIRRLFRVCIPEFLNLFPIFALILMILSLLLLLLELILYIIDQIVKLIDLILRNIIALNKAFQDADAQSILAIAKKIGTVLCQFQNLFVLFALFNVIIEVIRDILKLAFSIPPCDDGSNGDESDCCTPDVCPAFIANGDITRNTAKLQYLNAVSIDSGIVLPPPFSFNITARENSLQLYDIDQDIAQAFSNMFDAFDITPSVMSAAGLSSKTVFFPTDSTYDASTPPKQAPYTVDVKMLYNPISFGRPGLTRYIQFTNCIVTNVATRDLQIFDTSNKTINTGVIKLSGGYGTEIDGTPLPAYGDDGVTIVEGVATLNNFIFKPAVVTPSTPVYLPTDGYEFTGVEYIFRINHAVLMSKDIITARCEPNLSFDTKFINSALGNGIALKQKNLKDLLDKGIGAPGQGFPNFTAAQECLSTAISALRTNVTEEGVAQFQATTTICLDQLKDDTNSAISSIIGIGVDANKSDFTLDPSVQFVNNNIVVQVQLKESSGSSISSGLPIEVSTDIASKLKAVVTFGDVSQFTYDGYTYFTSNITSALPGIGDIQVMYDNVVFSTLTLPADLNITPSITPKSLSYRFIDSGASNIPAVRRDEGDISREGS